jgi:large subunit ribosomal protein L13
MCRAVAVRRRRPTAPSGAAEQLTKLKVYAGPDHPHQAQKPQPMEIEQ